MKTAILTGCGKGIGLATLKNFLRNDHELIFLCISRNLTNDLHALILDYPDRIQFFCEDVSNFERISFLITDFTTSYAYPSFCICNAGVRSRCSISDSDISLYSEIFNINTLSQINIVKTLLSCKPSVEAILNILFVTSIVGPRGFDELSTYAVSKSALEAFCRSAAVELAASNVRLNCIAPGFVESSYSESFRLNKPHLYNWTLDKTPLSRWGTCQEIANLIEFLVSEKNSFMTGSTVYCDGGWTAL